MTDNLGDIRLFVEAAQLGSLSAAGRKLGLTPAAASARLAKLESGLKVRLFERTTRQLRLTEELGSHVSLRKRGPRRTVRASFPRIRLEHSMKRRTDAGLAHCTSPSQASHC